MKKLLRVFSKAIALGTIAVTLSIVLKIIAFNIILENLRELWSTFFIYFGTTGTTATMLEYAETVLYTTALITVVGFALLAKGRGNENLGDKTFGKIPGIRRLWNFFHNITELIHTISDRPFVLIEDYPSKGHSTIGVITGKQAFVINNSTTFYKPSVYIPTPPNPMSGFLDFPEKDKLILMVSPANQIMRLIISIGILSPIFIKLITSSDQSLLDYYYEESPGITEDQEQSV